ncbi:MAG: hypothetical protein HQ518_26205 [Rhodopirellula sp.]|nr:hypothetical protein [Rhodopirellula sp.]
MALTLYDDESGSIYSIEVVFVTLLLVFGVIAGLTSYRDAIAQELGDTAVALDSIDQSYTFTLTNGPGAADDVTRSFGDLSTLSDPINAAPAGLSLTTAATAE